jgi:hypothetical protein
MLGCPPLARKNHAAAEATSSLVLFFMSRVMTSCAPPYVLRAMVVPARKRGRLLPLAKQLIRPKANWVDSALATLRSEYRFLLRDKFHPVFSASVIELRVANHLELDFAADSFGRFRLDECGIVSHPGYGCVVCALASEAKSAPEAIRNELSENFKEQVEFVAKALTGKLIQRRAIAILSALMGAVSMARTVNDPELARSILKESKRLILDSEKIRKCDE